MRQVPLLLLAFVPLLTGAARIPATLPSPEQLYISGKYDDAIAAGLAENDANGFVIAARAALAQEQMRDAPCLDCLRNAEDYARRAIAADPGLPEGHLYVAVSLGYEARIVGIIEARLHGYAEEAKQQLDTALKLDPGNAWALAALGGWNIEIVRNGGDTLAELIYGATLQSGLDDFARAFKLQPDNSVIRFQYALTLSGFDLAAFRHEIEDSLQRVANGRLATAYDALTRTRALNLLKLLRAGNEDNYLTQVRKYQGYP